MPLRCREIPNDPTLDWLSIGLRMAAKARLNPETGCLEWTGRLGTKGYGRFDVLLAGHHRSMPHLAHRVAYALRHGGVPDGQCVLHRCDNPPCINPDHLFLGTVDDNNKDCARKHRFSTPARSRATRGGTNNLAFLTAEMALAVRTLVNGNGESVAQVARNTGLSKSHVRSIATRKVWKRLPEDVGLALAQIRSGEIW